MRTSPDMLKLICEGPIFILEDVDGHVVGNSQALALDLKEAIELLRDLKDSAGEMSFADVHERTCKWLRLT